MFKDNPLSQNKLSFLTFGKYKFYFGYLVVSGTEWSLVKINKFSQLCSFTATHDSEVSVIFSVSINSNTEIKIKANYSSSTIGAYVFFITKD